MQRQIEHADRRQAAVVDLDFVGLGRCTGRQEEEEQGQKRSRAEANACTHRAGIIEHLPLSRITTLEAAFDEADRIGLSCQYGVARSGMARPKAGGFVNSVSQWIPAWATSVGVLTGFVVLVLGAHAVIHRMLARRSAEAGRGLVHSLIRHSRRPVQVLLPLLVVLVALPELPLPVVVIASARHAMGLVLIGTAAWLAIVLLRVAGDAAELKYRLDVTDNLAARRVLTQVKMLERVATTLILILTSSAMLMTFPAIRAFGASLLASAGLAGLVVGFAARPALSNLIAGVQVALTEPIRIDDVVIVEGEWGRIEEIRTSYVVIKIWDLRRLIVPISYFIEKPFQNWTRRSAELVGTVFLYVDYTAPVDAIRAELQRVLDDSKDLWDGQVGLLQVTDAKERTLELRALVSAPDSGKSWDLRCRVRERLVAFLQANYPQCLPRVRAEVDRETGDTEAAAAPLTPPQLPPASPSP